MIHFTKSSESFNQCTSTAGQRGLQTQGRVARLQHSSGRTCIFLFIFKKFFTHVINCISARSLWQILCAIYHSACTPSARYGAFTTVWLVLNHVQPVQACQLYYLYQKRMDGSLHTRCQHKAYLIPTQTPNQKMSCICARKS